ncbi:TIGR03885 family FMN-dependent LLM class oxidoreductase [Herpetosiphon sp. NSE202]|uniref:TIGR03885 family FMN-dependent LLM class oxidoreductase n=1 Tax=Herpetosiphon sp. NSE202 TaxID=3351349 RepID=UPI00363D8916
MVQIGYHASHEQFTPQALLHYVQVAATAGFTGVMASDHLAPWSVRQGQSGFVWSWLGAAMQATSLSFGMVNAPGQRYHPVIIAQAAATLAAMFPERLWCAFGTGQLMNEHVTGQRWPAKAERNARLLECVEVIRALWAGETVSYAGAAIQVDEAYLYTRPAKPPLLLGAAITPETAAWVASWADGIITVHKPLDQQRAFIEAFRTNGGEHKPIFLQAQTSYATSYEAALAGAYDQWRNAALPSTISTELRMPSQFDQLVDLIPREKLPEHIRISADLGQHREWLQQDIELGFERIYIHNVNQEQLPFLHAFGEHVLPTLDRKESSV